MNLQLIYHWRRSVLKVASAGKFSWRVSSTPNGNKHNTKTLIIMFSNFNGLYQMPKDEQDNFSIKCGISIMLSGYRAMKPNTNGMDKFNFSYSMIPNEIHIGFANIPSDRYWVDKAKFNKAFELTSVE